MTLRSNHSIGLSVASSLTLVGLWRTSIGPPISVMVKGVNGWFASDITATAASPCTQGWQTARMWARWPSSSRKRIT